MADYRLSAKIIGRSSGRSSVAAAAYRAGAQLNDVRTGLSHDYTRKNGVLHSEILAPDDAPDWMKDRARLWNAVETVERRKDAQLAREIQLSLPHELTEEQNRDLLFSFVQSHFVDHGMIADVAMHAPDRQGDQRNIHAHIMLTTRVLTSDGFGKKNRDWNTPEQLTEWRKQWAEHQNTVFQELNLEQRVDHRSLEAQGLDREPTQHLGPVANDMERNGKNSRVGEENRERQQRNAERARLAQEAAQTSQELASARDQLKEQELSDRASTQSNITADQIEQEQRHARARANLDLELQQRNGERREALQAQLQAVEQRLQADGWKKLMRDLLGRTERDRLERQATQLNLEDLRQKEEAERQELQRQQTEEKAQWEAQRIERERNLETKIEADRTTATEARREAETSSPVQTPANDRKAPSWTRTEAAEQDNAQHVPEFQKAAAGDNTAKQQAIEDHKARIKERLTQDRGREKDGYGYD